MKITTAEEMRTIDRVTSERYGLHSLGLMENAGIAVANFVREQWPHIERVTVICGKGNNGGDGFVAARKLHQTGKVVEVLLLGDPFELKGDAANMYGRLPLRPVIVRTEQELQNELDRGLGNAELIIDAVLGTGFQPPVIGLAAKAIEVMNRTSAKVLAVDIPSGAYANAFGPQPSFAARADAIVTFTAARPAHLLGQLTRGPVVVASIGSPDEAIISTLDLEVITSREVVGFVADRQVDSNKGRFGHVLVLGGSFGKSGAATMAGLAALRIGAGLTTVGTAASAVHAVAGYAPELMTDALPQTPHGTISLENLKQPRFDALLFGKTVLAVGPGLSRNPETAEFARGLLKQTELPIVIDADGLNAFEGILEELNGTGRTLVVTPHPGEMSRLTGMPVTEIQRDRIGAARSFAAEHSCIVVLKGHRTVVASPSGPAWLCGTGNPGMATGGTGDVLTGMISGMLAQFPSDPVGAVCAAVFLHGLAGDHARDKLCEQSMIATDVLHSIADAIKTVRNSKRKFVRVA